MEIDLMGPIFYKDKFQIENLNGNFDAYKHQKKT